MDTLSRRIYAYIQIFTMSLIFSSAEAALYKWVDEDGNTHYTQQKPPGDIEGEEIKPLPRIETKGAQEQLEEDQKHLEDSRKKREDLAKEKQEEESNKAIKKSNCELGKDKMTRLVTSPRVNKVDEDGTVTRVSEEERQEKIKQAQEMIDKNCN